MDRWVGKVAVVTGASSGLGAAISARLVKEGVKVVGLARRKERLDTYARGLADEKGQFIPFQADVTKEEDIVKAFTWTTQNVGLVHILVNNAGTFKFCNLLTFKSEDAKNILDLNVLSLSILCREALNMFKDNDIAGHIININSLAGHSVIDSPPIALYGASKHAVTALTESLYLEMKRLEMATKVTSLSPGLVETEIVDDEAWKVLKKDPGYCVLRPTDIADAVVYVLSTPPNVQVDELTIRPIYIKDS